MIGVELGNQVCYSEEDYSHTQLEKSRLCVLSDFQTCHSNTLSQCKFIDCLRTLDRDDGEMISHYLFSTCIPRDMTSRNIQNVCMHVAKGNDYLDYSKIYIDGERSKNEWRFNHMHYFLLVLIIIILILVLICSLSCYYHYIVLRTHKVPFRVPKFCPECLFPHSHYKRMIEHESFLIGQELNPQTHERSDCVSIVSMHQSQISQDDLNNLCGDDNRLINKPINLGNVGGQGTANKWQSYANFHKKYSKFNLVSHANDNDDEEMKFQSDQNMEANSNLRKSKLLRFGSMRDDADENDPFKENRVNDSWRVEIDEIKNRLYRGPSSLDLDRDIDDDEVVDDYDGYFGIAKSPQQQDKLITMVNKNNNQQQNNNRKKRSNIDILMSSDDQNL
eukprot:403332305